MVKNTNVAEEPSFGWNDRGAESKKGKRREGWEVGPSSDFFLVFRLDYEKISADIRISRINEEKKLKIRQIYGRVIWIVDKRRMKRSMWQKVMNIKMIKTITEVFTAKHGLPVYGFVYYS